MQRNSSSQCKNVAGRVQYEKQNACRSFYTISASSGLPLHTVFTSAQITAGQDRIQNIVTTTTPY